MITPDTRPTPLAPCLAARLPVRFAAIALVAWIHPAVGGASTAQSLDAVARRAEAAVREAIPGTQAGTGAVSGARHADAAPPPIVRIEARPPDPRLRLPDCAEPLQARLPPTTGGSGARHIVQVSCPAPTRWTVLVPVAVETETTVLVAGRALPRGAAPQAADLVAVRRVVGGFPMTYVNNPEDISGFHLARPLAAGSPLTRDMLVSAPQVRRGESVTLIAQVGGLEIRAPGRALADARPGEPVRVQNVNSLKIVEGRADNAGRVRVDP